MNRRSSAARNRNSLPCLPCQTHRGHACRPKGQIPCGPCIERGIESSCRLGQPRGRRNTTSGGENLRFVPYQRVRRSHTIEETTPLPAVSEPSALITDLLPSFGTVVEDSTNSSVNQPMSAPLMRSYGFPYEEVNNSVVNPVIRDTVAILPFTTPDLQLSGDNFGHNPTDDMYSDIRVSEGQIIEQSGFSLVSENSENFGISTSVSLQTYHQDLHESTIVEQGYQLLSTDVHQDRDRPYEYESTLKDSQITVDITVDSGISNEGQVILSQPSDVIEELDISYMINSFQNEPPTPMGEDISLYDTHTQYETVPSDNPQWGQAWNDIQGLMAVIASVNQYSANVFEW